MRPFFASRKRPVPALLALVPAISALGGCHEHFGAPLHVVHGRPVSVFAKPVGYAYPDIADRMRPLGYRPLPVPAQRPLLLDTPTSPTTPAPPPKTMRKQSSVAPSRAAPVVAAPVAATPAKPTVEIVPHQDEEAGRATTQMRR